VRLSGGSLSDSAGRAFKGGPINLRFGPSVVSLFMVSATLLNPGEVDAFSILSARMSKVSFAV